ncbi:hypothetical protein NYO99_16365 [Pelomonas sp. UHG3]|uniref:Uncharacterized protein n=1 Tax=Roseateles hydrophilus TaxID=2975054 RepID=A0ACC6CDQ3_9BURK|nr:hypothetical protein [Pelomonas sp. UHG3]MCY4746558.1 hypothetical protein [Pelomonas sp. UHG3]
MSDAIVAYFEALERLKKRGAKINNDTVAIEAGNKKGSIKRSRPVFEELIKAIDEAAAEQVAKRAQPEAKLVQLRDEKKTLRQLLDESIEREINLIDEIYTLKAQLAAYTAGKIVALPGGKDSSRQ